MKKFFSIVVLVCLVLIACDSGNGPTGNNNSIQKSKYQSTDTVKRTYSLTFPGIESQTKNRAAAGDSYVLLIEEIDETNNVIIKKVSEGIISSDSDGKLTLKPGNGNTQFTVTADNEKMTAITGTVTLKDGETERGPGTLTPVETVPDFTFFKDRNGKISIHKYEGTRGNVIIPSEIEGNPVTNIWNAAFWENKSITSVEISKGITNIGRHTFWSCSNLVSVTIPDTVTNIEGNTFAICTSLTSVTIPDSVTSIGEGAFSLCSSLTNVKIGNSVTSIGKGAFAACTSLTNITIPDSVTSIGYSAFSQCSSLTNITIPNSVTSIGDYAFHRCTALTSITIPDSVTSIGGFGDCTSLTSIIIPKNVTRIGDWAFTRCPNLTSITFLSDNINWGEYGHGSLGAAQRAGGAGTYTATAPVGNFSIWTKR